MDCLPHWMSFCFPLTLSLAIIFVSPVSGDASSLLGLKAAFDPHNTSHLQWSISDVCKWEGVRGCLRGRVSKLVIENRNLSGGKLEGQNLNGLDQLRVLSFKGNGLGGEIPDLSRLVNLKVVYLNSNAFIGGFPRGLVGLHRLKILVLSDNRLTGKIPADLTLISRLYTLYLDGNDLSGEIPPLNQSNLTFLNVSGNRLSGQIPATSTLAKFNASSFRGNLALCGPQVSAPCTTRSGSRSRGPSSSSEKGEEGVSRNKKKKIIIVVVSVAAGALVLLVLVILLLIAISNKRSRKVTTAGERGKKEGEVEAGPTTTSGGGGGRGVRERGEPSGNKGGFSWEGESLGKLVFVGVEAGEGEVRVRYSLEELLKASAETLGKGTVGSTYKAVMGSGYIVTVKRLKEARYPGADEFRRQMEVLGRMRHPNLVSVRAYFQAKEERLLVYDYFPNGSLFSLIHGSRPGVGGGGGKPLHWTSCLKIAEDVATGLLYIHQTFGLVHGNLKSSNVLLGSDFESCLTDYNLHPFQNPEATESSEPPSATSLFYRAPECRFAGVPSSSSIKPPTQQADVYSFGVLLLELLTGKTPFMDLVQEYGADIPKWVKSIREEETTDHSDPSSAGSGNDNNSSSEDKLTALLNIAMACLTVQSDSRPHIVEVLRMIREARAEGGSGIGIANNLSSANSSSGHSPGRWSDTVQSLPREDEQHQSI